MTIKKYIEENIDLIDDKNWKEFFKKSPHGVAELLYEAGIPFMQELGYIPVYMFYRCNSLTNMTIPDNVTSIGEWAFYGCTGLKSITIGNGVTSISDYAFSQCGDNLTINYDGTKAQWKNIYNKDAFTNTYFTVHCTDGDIIKKRR